MKPPQVKPSLLAMTAFLFMISLGSSLDCIAEFKFPLFFGNDTATAVISEASNKILSTLPEIARLGDKVSFPPDGPVVKALNSIFEFLKDKSIQSVIDGNQKLESEVARDAIKLLNAHMLGAEMSLLHILSSKASVDVKKENWLTAVNICEKVFTPFTDSKSVFNKAKLGTTVHYVAFATVYLTVAQLGKAFNPQYSPKLKKDMKHLLEDLAEFEYDVKPQRKHIQSKVRYCLPLTSCEEWLYDGITRRDYKQYASCRWQWRDEFTKGIKKFFTPIKESLAAFTGVPVPVKYQYYTRWGDECFYSCDFHEGKSYSWCWTLSGGLGKDWDYCSEKNDVTRYGVRCNSDHSCGLHGQDYYWCRTGSMIWDWDYCSSVTGQ